MTAPAAAHMMANAFQNLVYATADIEDPFPLATQMRSNVGTGVASAAAAPTEAAKVEEKPKEEEVEADIDMGGMFGDEEEY